VNQIEYWHGYDDTLGQRGLGPLIRAGRNKMRRIMKKYGLKARRQKRRYHYPGKASKVFDNLLRKHGVWLKKEIVVSDIFEVRLTDGSRLRGCFALWVRTRQVLSLAFDYRMKADLVVNVIEEMEFMDTDAIWHSDQGKQYGARDTIHAWLSRGFAGSMSRAGTPTDNAYAERFVQTFKRAVAHRWQYRTLGEFLEVAEDWINFYNNMRPHSGLNYLAPNQFAKTHNLRLVSYISLFETSEKMVP